MNNNFIETWKTSKDTVVSNKGIVVSQHYESSRIGANILESGGNAVDAAIATALSIGVIEPWMSGIGGGGFMLYYNAKTKLAHCIDFSMKSPINLNIKDYKLCGDFIDKDLFGWPKVFEDRNIHGPFSFATPGNIAGLSTALTNFGNFSWKEVIEPAIQVSKRGLLVDWYTTLRIATESENLSKYNSSKNFFLPNGFTPISNLPENPLYLINEKQISTLQRLRDAGPEDFYIGDIANTIIKDMNDLNGCISKEDLKNYKSNIREAGKYRHGDTDVFFADGLTAGPSLIDALKKITSSNISHDSYPDSKSYIEYIDILFKTYEERLTKLGDDRSDTCTTHISVIDKNGNIVSLTQTLLSVFGSKVLMPSLGFLMNNGIMWFDPQPSKPNSIWPAKTPLSNMCPIILTNTRLGNFALGASGGRRIFPSVFQLISFLIDYNMPIDKAIAFPRIDVSGSSTLTINSQLPKNIKQDITNIWNTTEMDDVVYPSLYACPNILRDYKGSREGVTFLSSPWSSACAEPS